MVPELLVVIARFVLARLNQTSMAILRDRTLLIRIQQEFLLLNRCLLAQFRQDVEQREANVNLKNRKRKCKPFTSVFTRKILSLLQQSSLVKTMMMQRKADKKMLKMTKMMRTRTIIRKIRTMMKRRRFSLLKPNRMVTKIINKNKRKTTLVLFKLVNALRLNNLKRLSWKNFNSRICVNLVFI